MMPEDRDETYTRKIEKKITKYRIMMRNNVGIGKRSINHQDFNYGERDLQSD